MAANIIGRYVWLIDTLRRYEHLSYKEINAKWQESGLSYGDGDELPLRTFHNHCTSIQDIFGVDIEYDKSVKGFKYHIANPDVLEKDNLRLWLIDSYTALNHIQADSKLQGRIIFENVPSGHAWLHAITDAMRTNTVLEITHQGFGKPEANTFEIEPYYLKVVHRRWYVLARSPYYSDYNRRKNADDGGDRPEDVFLVYALDRIGACNETSKKFEMIESFDIDEYFRGCCGIIASKEKPVEMILKAYAQCPDYLRTLPLHESQVELTEMNDDEACYFKYQVRPTYELYQALLAQADQVQVISPESIKTEMRNFAKNIMAYYKD